MSRLKRLYREQTNINFLGRRKLWFAISGAFIVACLLMLPFRPAPSSCSPPLPSFFAGLSCGIEFKGGVQVEAPVEEGSELAALGDVAIVERVRSELEPLGASGAQIQVATAEGGERSVIVQTSAVGDTSEQQAVTNRVRDLSGSSVADSPTSSIGRKWGGEITSKAVQALLIFLLVVAVFLTWRFEWKVAVGAFGALFHDLIITAGVYAAVGFQVTPSTVIAILTILGYSLYDTVVVFDKVEENTSLYAATGKMTYEASANVAMNQVFMRSLNTSLTTLLPVSALLIAGTGLLGASTLKDLALALLVGIIVSAYSSIYVATPILTLLKEREPRFRNVREKVLRDAKRTAALTPAPAGVPADSVEATDGARATAAAAPKPAGGAPQARPRAGSKKAKRRKRR